MCSSIYRLKLSDLIKQFTFEHIPSSRKYISSFRKTLIVKRSITIHRYPIKKWFSVVIWYKGSRSKEDPTFHEV